MTRQYHPFINPLTGLPECLYAGCGREIPSDHYLCKKHYFRLSEGLVEPCPGGRDASGSSPSPTNAAPTARGTWSRRAIPRGRRRRGLQRVLRLPPGPLLTGVVPRPHARMATAWFGSTCFRRGGEAAARELELKHLVMTDLYAVLDMVFAFQDRIALVQSLNRRIQR